MKRGQKQFMAFVMAVLMLVTSLPMEAWAAGTSVSGGDRESVLEEIRKAEEEEDAAQKAREAKEAAEKEREDALRKEEAVEVTETDGDTVSGNDGKPKRESYSGTDKI